MKKILIVTNIILFICLVGALTLIYKNYNKIFIDEYRIQDGRNFLDITLSDYDFMGSDESFRGYSIHRGPNNHDETYWRDSFAAIMSPGKVIGIYKAMILYTYCRSDWIFEKPKLGFDEINDTYVVMSLVHTPDMGGSEYIYRFEISKEGDIIDMGYYYDLEKIE